MLWAEGATNAKTHRLRRACDRQKVTMMGPQSKVGISGRSRDGTGRWACSVHHAEEFEFYAGAKRK